MKKIQSFIWIPFCMMLTGCNENQEGITFYTKSSDKIAVTETTWEWSLIIAMVVIFVVIMLYILLIIKRHALSNNKNAWGETTAFLTGKCNTYMASVRKNGYYSTPEPKKEYQIEYFVNGKQYLRYIGEKEMCGLSSEHIKLQYLKKRPAIFRII
ncbi:MAG TPA: hypothetical protein VJY54_06295 [Lachnospiraceae bacterium]|nr:hypothetical protein [Lachnospiraceae bacterium]